MGVVKIPGLKIKRGPGGIVYGYYFEPTPKMRESGFRPEALGKEPGPAYARAQQLAEEWRGIRRGERPQAEAGPAKGSFAWLCDRFRKSSRYTELADVTKDEGERHMAIICASPLGKATVRQIRHEHCVMFHDKRCEIAGVAHANRTAKWLCWVLSYGRTIGQVTENPASGMKLHAPPPRRQRWTVDQIEAFKAAAVAEGYPAWALAVQLAYDTSQRLGDLLRAAWTAYDGKGIEIRQSKTGAAVYVTLDAETRRMLAETPRTAVVILAGVKGGSINRHYFNRMFREIRARAGLPAELQFRDLRRTAISEAYNAGADPSPLSGHRPGSNQLRVYAVPDRRASERVQRARKRERKAGKIGKS